MKGMKVKLLLVVLSIIIRLTEKYKASAPLVISLKFRRDVRFGQFTDYALNT